MSVQAQAVVAAAKSQLGYREGINNDNKYAKAIAPSLNHQPWCAIFVSWCFDKAGATKLIDGQYSWGFAGCTGAMRQFIKDGMRVPKRSARPGDIVFFDFNDSDITSEHVGIVVESAKTWGLVTVEGNTCAEHATGSQANGNGVYRRNRPYGVILAVVRPKWKA